MCVFMQDGGKLADLARCLSASLTATIAPVNSFVCSLDLMTSVGTRTRDDAVPAAAPATMGPRYDLSSSTWLSTHFLMGSYTEMKMADAGATPTRFWSTPDGCRGGQIGSVHLGLVS